MESIRTKNIFIKKCTSHGYRNNSQTTKNSNNKTTNKMKAKQQIKTIAAQDDVCISRGKEYEQGRHLLKKCTSHGYRNNSQTTKYNSSKTTNKIKENNKSNQ